MTPSFFNDFSFIIFVPKFNNSESMNNLVELSYPAWLMQVFILKILSIFLI